ncbi:MAG: hypothetical protein JNK49_15920 [Planctomycetes bacterium]|nr:hypothetical protein [Planctomycetota bacterium]
MVAKKSKKRFDTRAKQALAQWPHVSRKLWPPSRPAGAWLKAQPVDGSATGPRLVAAGTDTFKTQPDGLWVFLSEMDGFADCVAIEACSSASNFADKRSRYQPSTTATVLHCPGAWLRRRVTVRNREQARWSWAGLTQEPDVDLRLPTRFVRVLFFLKDDLYQVWRSASVPSAHEFVASYSSIKSYTSQAMQKFLRRMSPEQHFYKK